MRRNLQSKFNLLTIVLIVFALLMVPMFNQVKADTRESIPQAKNTLLNKMFREVAKDFKPRNLENTEVEDYWAEQAKRQDPNCGEACDPNADRDGDGMSNGDEVRAGRNPSCNEEKLGADYCKGQDPYNLTEPDPVVQRAERIFLGYVNWTLEECGGGPVAPSLNCGTKPFFVPTNSTLLECYANATQYTGSSWSITIRNSEGSIRCPGLSQGFNPQNRQFDSARHENPEPGAYSAQLAGQAVQSGRWELMLWATVVR